MCEFLTQDISAPLSGRLVESRHIRVADHETTADNEILSMPPAMLSMCDLDTHFRFQRPAATLPLKERPKAGLPEAAPLC